MLESLHYAFMAQYANQGDSRFVFVNAHPPLSSSQFTMGYFFFFYKREVLFLYVGARTVTD